MLIRVSDNIQLNMTQQIPFSASFYWYNHDIHNLTSYYCHSNNKIELI